MRESNEAEEEDLSGLFASLGLAGESAEDLVAQQRELLRRFSDSNSPAQQETTTTVVESRREEEEGGNDDDDDKADDDTKKAKSVVASRRVAAPRRRTHQMIEIVPGFEVPLRDVEETKEASAEDNIRCAICMGCSAELKCIRDVEYVICPLCSTITPMSLAAPPLEDVCSEPFGAGIGYTDD